MGGIFSNYVAEMGSRAVIYVPSFIKIGSGIPKSMGGIHRHTHRQQRDVLSLLFFFQNKESGLKKRYSSIFYSVQTGSGAHPSLYPVAPGSSFPGGKQPGHEIDSSPPSSAAVKSSSYTSTPPYVFMAWCLLNHTGDITFLPLPKYELEQNV
jgi:hypothetical protein